MSSRPREFLIGLCLLSGSSALFLGSMEILLRVSGLVSMAPQPPPIYRTNPDPRISYELRPDISETAYRSTVTTNSRGFRSPELDGRPIVAVLGDSITFGYGVEDGETIAARLQEHVPERQFLNAGVPGYHLGQETAVYETKLSGMDPKALIVVMHPNDMRPDTGWLDADGILRSGSERRDAPAARRCSPLTEGLLSFVPGQCWLDAHSAIYVAVRKAVTRRSIQTSLEDIRTESLANPEQDSITDEQIAAYARQLDALLAAIPPELPRLFVMWPDHELHAPSRPKILAAARERGFATVDLYETFGNTARTLGWDNVHPHPETIDQAAAVIAAHLRNIARLPQ